MIFKKLLSIGTISMFAFTSSSFKLNSKRITETKTIERETTPIDTSLRTKILKETGVSLPKKMSCSHIRTMYNEAKKKNVPLKIVVKVIQRESKFDPKALNTRTGARGYMQLMPRTYMVYRRKLNLSMNPTNNIIVGTHILREMYDYWDKKNYSENTKWRLALASYNAGIDRVIRAKKVPNIKETINFVDFILE